MHSLLDEREGSLLSQRQRSYIEEQHELITELRARLGRMEEELHAREAEVDDLRATRPSQAKYFDLEEKYRALREENREVRNRLQDATEAGQSRQNDVVATLESQLARRPRLGHRRGGWTLDVCAARSAQLIQLTNRSRGSEGASGQAVGSATNELALTLISFLLVTYLFSFACVVPPAQSIR
jgi:DNA repair exonuclease SbcCD ATPase subunit